MPDDTDPRAVLAAMEMPCADCGEMYPAADLDDKLLCDGCLAPCEDCGGDFPSDELDDDDLCGWCSMQASAREDEARRAHRLEVLFPDA